MFGPAKVAVFVDGCFWHGCPVHGVREHRTNSEFWEKKIAKNRARDADTDTQLLAAGWLPVRVWEHETVDEAAGRVVAAVGARKPRKG